LSTAVEPSGTVRYDRVARTGHWLVAALTVVAVLLGWVIAGTPRNTPQRDLVLLLHRSLGLTILAAVVFRAGWRWRHPAPPLPPAFARVERVLARSTHFMLYVILIVIPLAGYLNAAAAGHAVSLFGILWIPPCLPENDRVSQAAIAVHLIGQYILYLFVGLHTAGALYHGVIRRDGILDRMLPARRRSNP
jgi:cytochrome b561